MKYNELFLMNHVYVDHPNKNIPIRLCPRDEIAHPKKIHDAIFSKKKRWHHTKINNVYMSYKRINYNKQLYDDICASHFYVVTESRSIFKDCKRVNKYSHRDMVEFLSKHQSTLFLITTPVFNLTTEEDTYFSMPATIEQTPYFSDTGTTITLRDLIDSQSYTVCNGITVFLAMLRSKIWDIHEARIAIEEWYQFHKNDNVEMSEVWQFLYINHPIPMIAEFPIYYATMYPAVPDVFFKFFDIEDTVPLAQFMNENNDTCFHATPITSMFPYFNRSVFNYYNNDFSSNDSTTDLIFDVPYNFEESDLKQIDIEGFFISIVRSRRAWRWWKSYGRTYLEKLLKTKKDPYKIFNHCMVILFFLYEMPYPDIKYPHWRVRAIWNLVLSVFNVDHVDIQLFLTVNVVRNIIYRSFEIIRINPIMPLPFIIDVMKHYNKKINWFNSHRYKLYTIHDIDIIRAIFSPYIHLNNEDFYEYILQCSLYQLFKLDTDYNVFVEHIINKKIATNIIYIDRIFGLTESSQDYECLDNNFYTVGILIKEYLRDNRNDII